MAILFLFCFNRIDPLFIPFYSDEKGALDESDQFLVDPAGFATEFSKNWSIPSHIVLFDFQEKLLKDFLALHNFEEVAFFRLDLLL